MLKKILVAEDLDSIGIGMEVVLKTLNIQSLIFTKYCDEAFLKLRKAQLDNEPFDLLITDLSFTNGNRNNSITSGEDLIKAIRKEGLPLKIIAYSIEERGYKIRHLLDECHIDGYVLKSRESISQLQKAIDEVYSGKIYLSPELQHLRKPDMLVEMDATDLEIIKLLANGLIKSEIVQTFKTERKKVSSTSSVEKRITKMRTLLQARNTTHLISIAKDMGLV